jgi:choline dehydrogenase-like flavoprotein
MEGVKWARKIAGTAPLSADNAGELIPTPADPEKDLQARIIAGLQTVYHPTSTCRMGSDEGAVVDPTLKMNGMDGLWIADASVMPTVPRGHPNVPVAMVANRAASWIERG